MSISTSAGWQTLPDSESGLGESPFWHPQEQALYWVDIPGRQIKRCVSGQVERWPLAQDPGCIAPARSGGLVMALRDGIYRARHWGGPLTLLHAAPYDTATTRFNDGKCDSLGRFWAGTIFEPRNQHVAELLCLDRRTDAAAPLASKAGQGIVGNGLAWAADQRTLYWANTADHVVWAWDFDLENAQLSHRRVFHQFPQKPADWRFDPAGGHLQRYGGRPDGAAVDALGHYWVAMFEGQRLCRFAPDGQLLQEIATPALCTTMPCFGGPDLRTLYITTARHGRSETELTAQPLAGSVFHLRVDTPGLPVSFFEGS